MRTLLFLLTFSSLGACAPEQTVVAASQEDELLAGRFTFEHPEVGSIQTAGSCTATLFGSARTVVTAAHCVAWASQSFGNHGVFTLEPRPGERFSYVIQQIRVFGAPHEESANDVALLQLAEAVPPSVARPARPALAGIPFGTPMTIFGYGCQTRPRGGAFAKQSFTYSWGNDTFNLCPGDSGGPTLTPAGDVVRVNSAYITSTGRDLFGDVPRHASSLRAFVDAWRGSSALVWDGETSSPPLPAPEPTDPPPSTPEPAPPSSDDPIALRCAAHLDCGSCVSDNYCGWCGGCVALHLDDAGNIGGDGCTTPVELWSCPAPSDPSPPPAEPPPAPPASSGESLCGEWEGAYDFECAADASRFVRCTSTGLDFADCPAGSVCAPGSTELYCSIR